MKVLIFVPRVSHMTKCNLIKLSSLYAFYPLNNHVEHRRPLPVSSPGPAASTVQPSSIPLPIRDTNTHERTSADLYQY